MIGLIGACVALLHLFIRNMYVYRFKQKLLDTAYHKAVDMQIDELHIGDWILWMGNPCQVDLALLNTEFTDRIESDNIQPIPVTISILKKNGFESYQDDYYWELNGRRICVSIGLFLTTCKVENKLKNLTAYCGCNLSVSQLQRMIWICQIDKDIKL